MLRSDEPLQPGTPILTLLHELPDRSLFFDIETTGLSPSSSALFLIGAVFFDGTSWILRQFLADSEQDEYEVLSSFFALAEQYDTLVHFNGTTFDLPYLAARAACYHLNNPLAAKQSVDLYRRYRPLQKFLQLDRMKQISLEQAVGWKRKDQLGGRQMITLYQKYTASGEPLVRELLLLHNHDDMIGMLQILVLEGYLTLLSGSFGEITDVRFMEGDTPVLRLTFTLAQPLPVPFSAQCGGNITVCAQESSGMVQCPVTEGTLYHFFPDYRNYYYLPMEDQAIHKSVASFVDSAYRTKARASNCYIKKSGWFVFQPEHIFSPAFQISYEDKSLYFELNQDLSCPSGAYEAYLSALLRAAHPSSL